MQSRVTVLALCTSSHVALHLCKVSWKYLKRFLGYRADTILWQTGGRTDDQGKNNMSPNPTVGRHNDSWQKRFVLLGQIDLPSGDKADTTRRKWLMAEDLPTFRHQVVLVTRDFCPRPGALWGAILLFISYVWIHVSKFHFRISIIHFWISIIHFWISKNEFRMSQNKNVF